MEVFQAGLLGKVLVAQMDWLLLQIVSVVDLLAVNMLAGLLVEGLHIILVEIV